VGVLQSIDDPTSCMCHLCETIFKKGERKHWTEREGNEKRVRNNRGNTKPGEEGSGPGRAGTPLKVLQPVEDSSKRIRKRVRRKECRSQLQ